MLFLGIFWEEGTHCSYRITESKIQNLNIKNAEKTLSVSRSLPKVKKIKQLN